MGKAKRAKLKRQEDARRISEQQSAKHAERKETAKILLVVVSIMLAISLVVGVFCFVAYKIKESGNYLRDRVTVKSADYEVNNAMMSYFFHDNFYQQKQYYDYYSSYFKLDTSKSLKMQDYSTSMTWYDYFIEQASENVKSILVFAQAAKDEGITLDDADNKMIEDQIADIKAAADEAKITPEKYIFNNYGLGVTEQDIRDSLELYYTSQKLYYNIINGIDYTTDEISAYYDEHSSDYMKVNYKSYACKSYNATDATDSEKEAAYDKAESYANELAKSTTAKDFDIALKAYLLEVYKDNNVTYTDAEIEETIENSLTEGEAYTANSEYSEWLFNSETKAGDTKIIDNGSGTYTVYLLTEAAHREEYTTKNVRHILLSLSDYDTDDECKAAAEAVLAEYNNGAKTEEAFSDLAVKYSTDTGSVSVGGLYKNILKGEMTAAFDEWCYDDARSVGDVDIVKTTYGYHVMYFAGNGLSAWESEVFNDMQDAEYTEISEDYTEKYEVTADTAKMNNIPDINS